MPVPALSTLPTGASLSEVISNYNTLIRRLNFLLVNLDEINVPELAEPPTEITITSPTGNTMTLSGDGIVLNDSNGNNIGNIGIVSGKLTISTPGEIVISDSQLTIDGNTNFAAGFFAVTGGASNLGTILDSKLAKNGVNRTFFAATTSGGAANSQVNVSNGQIT